MLNHIVIMGRLTRDPELRYTQSQLPVATFRVAVDRDFGRGEEKQTDFIDVRRLALHRRVRDRSTFRRAAWPL